MKHNFNMENKIPTIVENVLSDEKIKKIERKDLKELEANSIIDLLSIIPTVGGLLSSGIKAYMGFREVQFFRKFISTIYGIQDISAKKLKSFLAEVEKKANDCSGDVIANIIDRIDNINKGTVLANLIKAKINDKISIEDFFRLTSVLERIPYVDFIELKKYKIPFYNENGGTELLYTTGALKLDTIGLGGEDLYKLSELGIKLIRFGLDTSIELEAKGGTKIATITNSEIGEILT